jgi:hypothetical protein
MYTISYIYFLIISKNNNESIKIKKKEKGLKVETNRKSGSAIEQIVA